MNIYFDTEFTGLQKDTTLISIGLIAEDGSTFYAEFTDYNKSQCDDWIRENVINNLLLTDREDDCYILMQKYKGLMKYPCSLEVKHNKTIIKRELLGWLEQFDEIQLVSDVCHYDMVLFIDIFGSAWDLPKNIAPCCVDINQMIAEYLNTSNKEAFDLNREHFLLYLEEGSELPNGNKHNSLFDAKVIKGIYERINW